MRIRRVVSHIRQGRGRDHHHRHLPARRTRQPATTACILGAAFIEGNDDQAVVSQRRRSLQLRHHRANPLVRYGRGAIMPGITQVRHDEREVRHLVIRQIAVQVGQRQDAAVAAGGVQADRVKVDQRVMLLGILARIPHKTW